MTSRVSRRAVIRGVAGAAIGFGALDAFAVEPRWLDVRRFVVRIPDLASEREGFTIAHVTDVHLTRIGGLHDAIASALEAAKPELVVVTGDVVDADEHIVSIGSFVARLRAGGSRVVATLGNWEHWGGVNVDALRAAYRDAGAQLLVDEHVSLERGLVLVATDDSCSGFGDLARAFRDAPENERTRPRILLSHAPGIFDDQAIPPAARAALSLSGHTHGGQVTAFTKAIWVPPGSGRFVAGAYSTDVGPLYVSRGIGTSVVPARFCARPELPIFTLRRGDRAEIVAS